MVRPRGARVYELRVSSGLDKLLAKARRALRMGRRDLYEYYMRGVRIMRMLDGLDKTFVKEGDAWFGP